jgi:3-oxoacyl-[acyl-carrier protein] reductase
VDLELQGRAAVVTGGSRGIGRAIAAALTAEGARVLLCARDPEALAAAAADLPGAATLALDVTDDDAPQRIVDACQRELGRLDIVVNNAGTALPKPLPELTAEDWREAFELLFLSAARLSTAAAPVMAAAGWGRLVHVASISGREPDPSFAPYSAAKAALLNLSTSLAQAYGPQGVLSSCVVPGITLTELVQDNAQAAAAAGAGADADEVVAKMLRRHRVPVGRFGTPEEVADAVVFLCSQRASWVNGATLEVDGGTLRSV